METSQFNRRGRAGKTARTRGVEYEVQLQDSGQWKGEGKTEPVLLKGIRERFSRFARESSEGKTELQSGTNKEVELLGSGHGDGQGKTEPGPVKPGREANTSPVNQKRATRLKPSRP